MDSRNLIKRTVFPCYITYLLSGFVILCFGAIMPELIEDKGLSYTLAGGLLTCLAIGNLLASFVYPIMCAKLDERYVSTILCTLYPICLFAFTVVDSIVLLYVLIFFIGINKGVITLVNNRVVNAATNNSVKHLNLLHMSYAIGALLSPFLIAVLTKVGVGWETLLRIIAVLTVIISVLYSRMDMGIIPAPVQKSDKPTKGKQSYVFFLSAMYWIATGMIFCYMGLENTVNGWFETYLQGRGLLSPTMATVMVSVTWLMIMIGRIIIASLSDKIKTEHILLTITAIQLVAIVMLIAADSAALVVTALVILGLGLAGTYPTIMSYVGKVLNNSNIGISVVTGIGSLGGILTPQFIGIVADKSGFSKAILLMAANSVVLTLLGLSTVLILIRRKK